MGEYSSNYYGFVRARLLNTYDEFFLSKEEAPEGINGTKKSKKIEKSNI